MTLLYIFLFFILPSNVVLLALLVLEIEKKIGKSFSLLLSYSLAPLLNGLFFYTLTLFFPGENDLFYVSLIFLFWLVLLVSFSLHIKKIKSIYFETVFVLKENLKNKKVLLFSSALLFILLFSIQSLSYPISEGDSAYYFAQSNALYHSKNPNWYKSGPVLLDGYNNYYNNDKIRPGLPSTSAFMFLLGDREWALFAFQFLYVYYYFLMVLIATSLAGKIAESYGKNADMARFFTVFFTVFYWNMARFFIFNNKEVVIFSLALLGFYLTYLLSLRRKMDSAVIFITGSVLGLNSFLNFHGTILALITLLVLLIFSKMNLWKRFLQVILIFSISIFFGALEFFHTFVFIFVDTIGKIFGNDISGLSVENSLTVATEVVKEEHREMYQMTNITTVYLKGKLQMMTNIVSYGLFFWVFIVMLLARFKELISSRAGRMFLSFIGIYYFIVIDPFNLNKNDLAIVLWGSPKYAMFVVFLSIIFLSVHLETFIRILSALVEEKKKFILTAIAIIIVSLAIFKDFILDFAMKTLSMLFQIQRDSSFYESKLELFYLMMFGCLFFGALTLTVGIFNPKKRIIQKGLFVFIGSFMIIPFFVANPGKVPLSHTITYLKENRETKLRNTIYFGSLFDVYYEAKKILPEQALIRTPFLELYTYNDYFQLKESSNPEAKYEITNGCPGGQSLYQADPYVLCQIRD